MSLRNPVSLSSLLTPSNRRRLFYGATAFASLSTALLLARPARPALRPVTNTPSAFSTMSGTGAGTGPRYNITPYTPSTTTPSQQPTPHPRADESPDSDFYSSPRFVTHIDDNAIAALTEYYGTVLPTGPAPSHAPEPAHILDLCSSWISHYPPSLATASTAGTLSITGLGMNAAELSRNPLLTPTSRIVHDLNTSPDLTRAALALPPSASLDATTCTVSIDYLTQPVRVLRAIRTLTRPGGSVHLAVSNRCFPTKAVRRWLSGSEDERLALCAEDLRAAGWADVEIVEVTDGSRRFDAEGREVEGEEEGARPQGGMAALLARMGMPVGGGDPLWVVRGRNPEG